MKNYNYEVFFLNSDPLILLTLSNKTPLKRIISSLFVLDLNCVGQQIVQKMLQPHAQRKPFTMSVISPTMETCSSWMA